MFSNRGQKSLHKEHKFYNRAVTYLLCGLHMHTSTKTACSHINIILFYANYQQRNMHTTKYTIDMYEARPHTVHHTHTEWYELNRA